MASSECQKKFSEAVQKSRYEVAFKYQKKVAISRSQFPFIVTWVPSIHSMK